MIDRDCFARLLDENRQWKARAARAEAQLAAFRTFVSTKAEEADRIAATQMYGSRQHITRVAIQARAEHAAFRLIERKAFGEEARA